MLYRGQAKALVNRYCRIFVPRSDLRDDIESEAMIGLWQACQRFQENNNNTFWTFAKLRVRGAILDFLRRERLQVRSDGKDGWHGKTIDFVAIDQFDHFDIADSKSGSEFDRINSMVSVDKSMGVVLSDKQRRVMAAYYIEGKTVREIGAEYGSGTIVAIQQGTELLRAALSE